MTAKKTRQTKTADKNHPDVSQQSKPAQAGDCENGEHSAEHPAEPPVEDARPRAKSELACESPHCRQHEDVSDELAGKLLDRIDRACAKPAPVQNLAGSIGSSHSE